ncbi:MAG: metallophosphoesterase [Bacillota bacterium]
MSIYAIGDLHFSFTEIVTPGEWNTVKPYKPMDCFGENWVQHYEKIYNNWKNKIEVTDTVLIPGDLSWAMKLEDIEPDLDFLAKLPGKKILLKGNHDYWWEGISKVRSQLPEDTFALQYDSLKMNDIYIAGTRGWTLPSSSTTSNFDDHDEKIYNREVMRLEMSLKSIEEKAKTIVMFHYMPVNEKHEKNEFIQLLIDYEVDICIYGHLHGKESHENRISGKKWGIKFHLVSADFLNFSPKLIY